MPTIAFTETWNEICYILHDSITSKINEKEYENKVLRVVEKLGWREYKGEIETQPTLNIGRNSTIRPDIVVYGANRQALFVIEVKRPEEDISRDDSIGQLKSYMRHVKADFGLLVGIEIRLYYDGQLKSQTEPILLDKISFDHNASSGERFVSIFNRENFLDKKYDSSLNDLIKQFKEKRNIKELRKL